MEESGSSPEEEEESTDTPPSQVDHSVPISKPTPTTLTSLQFRDPCIDGSANIYATLKSLRRSTLSISNRLRSIVADFVFVESVSARYPSLAVVANERCGSWYVNPSLKKGSCYFKSTDGHFGEWGFSLRRLNLLVLDLIASSTSGGDDGGCIIVDSTRRGKVMPDALAKTAPIWVAVVNCLCFPERVEHEVEEMRAGWWGGEVQWAEGMGVVGKEEVRRIQSRVQRWVEQAQGLGVQWKGRLRRPLKCFWVANTDDHYQEIWPQDPTERDGWGRDWDPIILCSASRPVKGAEMSEGGYVQGAGDDSEGWAGGLTPELFWRNREVLLGTREEDLEMVVREFLEERRVDGDVGEEVLVRPTGNVFLGREGMSQDLKKRFDFIVNCNGCGELDGVGKKGKTLDLNLNSVQGKLGSRELRRKLGKVKEFVSYNWGKDSEQRLLITCHTGKDLSVGVALVVLCLFVDNDGKVDSSVRLHQGLTRGLGLPIQNDLVNKIDKSFVRQRLAWVTSSKPAANPSRSTLQAVNSFLMDRP